VTAPWQQLPGPVEKEIVFDPEAYALGRTLASLIGLGLATDKRSLQQSIGSSEVGHVCDRRVSYKVHNVPPSNTKAQSGRLRRAIGTGVHLMLANVFTDLDKGSGQFLIEQNVVYKGIPGTADLVYRMGHTVVDWKTAKKAKIARVRKEGVPRYYQVQVQLYAAGLIAAGEDIRHVAVVYVPIDVDNDEDLEQLHVWLAPVNVAMADDAVQRLERLSTVAPADAIATPDRMCGYCNHFLPGSTNLAVGCPGMNKETK
jgi:hypothetical protein